ncbi:uromodulin-like [Spea bombifrons]|uniref:uromodulin-like n=1 Tax=Spea bombifrons TaxID=233779 RepID=UPI00234B8D85|nr:uromodulin-like [Spea bombifrons]
MFLLLLTFLICFCGATSQTTTAGSRDKPSVNSTSDGTFCVLQRESSALTYLVDTTGSMSDDFQQLKLVNSWLLDRVTARFPCGVRQYTMVEYNDPSIGPVKVTDSKREFNNFFNSLLANGGGDCPELALGGLELALRNSPSNSFILVLTDASAKDYHDVALLERIQSLLNTTKSQVFFLITGLCSGLSDPAFLVYREIAFQSFGHVFQVGLSDLGKVFNYLDFTLSRPINSSEQLFSGDYTVNNHSESFRVTNNFTALIVTTDGVIYSFKVVGPDFVDLELKKIVSEIWGSMYLLKNPGKGAWTIYIYAGGRHSVRVEGFKAVNISSASHCSECHPNATCEEYDGFLECSCKNGFIGDGFTCSDIDECAYSWSNNCSFGLCENTFGSYTCLCPRGYTKTAEHTCTDVNECSSPDLNGCDPLSTCVNYIGGYSCVCPTGYFGNGSFCEFNECLTGVCGSGVECIKSRGSYSCVDPCLNHTVLDEPWRSSSNTILSRWNCDVGKVGWHRFVGRGGVRISETCVPQYSCDTAAPMWLRGSHPLLGDGIINGTACAHTAGDCCRWRTNVQIKACPGGYHVYKLSGTPYCTLSYCTDPASSNFSCAADEEWKLKNGVYGCYCKDKYKLSTIADIRPVLTCGARDMRATFQKCQLKELKINVHKIGLKDAGCLLFEDDTASGTLSVISPLQVGTCGAQLIKNSTHAVYKNTLSFSLDIGDIIVRTELLSLTMSCSYQLDMIISLNTAIKPIVSSTNISIGGTGQFTAYMALFKDSTYTVPYEGSEIVLSSKATLYIGLFVDGGEPSQFAVVMKNCYATPTESPDDPVKYYIIRDSCPSKQDSTITVTENGGSKRGSFSLQVFKFIGDYNYVYLHCQIRLCDPKAGVCSPSCSGIGSRSAEADVPAYNLKVGPIFREDRVSSGAIGTCASWGLLPMLLLLAKELFL